MATTMRNVPFLPLLFAVLSLTWFSCENETSAPLPEEGGLPENPSVYIIFPPNGPGDNGFLDKLMSATTEYAIEHPGEVRILLPEDSLQAEIVLSVIEYATMDESRKDTALTVFIGSEYKKILYQASHPEGKQKVLLMEDDGEGAPEWLHTCMIERYGACYLAGAMLAQQKASIVAAMPGESSLERSIEGFKKGYGSIKGREVDAVYYLADNHKGFTMQHRAHQLCDSIQESDKFNYHTIFPLAGAANLGMYNAIGDSFTQIIGMDKDYSSIGNFIPFSINVGIDALLLDCLAQWDDSHQLPKHRKEGLDSGFIEFVFNDTWNSDGTFYDWEDENQQFNEEDKNKVLTTEFWKKRYALFKDQAIKEEKTYEKQH